MTEASGYRVFLDWQGVNPTALWVGNPGSQYSSREQPQLQHRPLFEHHSRISGQRSPEPASFVLAGLGLAGAYWFGAAKLSRSLAARRPSPKRITSLLYDRGRRAAVSDRPVHRRIRDTWTAAKRWFQRAEPEAPEDPYA